MRLWPSALSIRYACILESFRPSIVTYKRVSRRQIISHCDRKREIFTVRDH